MKVIKTKLPGVLLIEPKLFGDTRGRFFETYQQQRYAQHGIPTFVQDNTSVSGKHVLRGLHYQLPYTQGKLVFVTLGRVLDVIVDIRQGSPTFGQHITVELDAELSQQLYIPPGFAHGFIAKSTAHFHYKCTDYYQPQAEKGIIWNDPTLNINWGCDNPELSDKDKRYPRLENIAESDLPRYKDFPDK